MLNQSVFFFMVVCFFPCMHLDIEQRIKCFALIAHKSEVVAYLSIMVALTALTVAITVDYL